MYELKVTVTKVMGVCSAAPAMSPGDSFSVSDGDIQIPEGGHICLWALQSLMPLLPAKERNITEAEGEDWMGRVKHAQCPDPDGRVIFKIERTGKLQRRQSTPAADPDWSCEKEEPVGGDLKALSVVVESCGGHCTSRMGCGDRCELRSGRLYIPRGRHFCLYALQAVLPLLPAKQRFLREGDWMKEADRILCPDPAGNVILRIEETS